MCRPIEWDCRTIEPQVSFPFLPSNAKPISEAAAMQIAIQQSVVGSCTNGRIEDLRVAAAILKGRKVHPDVRMIIFPATQAIWQQAVREGLMEIFVDAEAAVSTPTCGPCLGGHMGILAEGERAVATTNRNFVGPDGAYRQRSLPGQPGHCRRLRGAGAHRQPGRARYPAGRGLFQPRRPGVTPPRPADTPIRELNHVL